MSTESVTGATAPVVSAFRAAFVAGKEMARTGVSLPTSWTDEAREMFEERAALLEYSGGHTRDEAEQLAVTDVCLALGVDRLQQKHPAPAAAPKDDGLTDLFGDIPVDDQSLNAIAAGH